MRALSSTLVGFSVICWSRSTHYSCSWAFQAVKQLVAVVNQKALQQLSCIVLCFIDRKGKLLTYSILSLIQKAVYLRALMYAGFCRK